VPQPHVNFIEEDIHVYSIFLEEDGNYVTQPLDPEDGIWHMHFDGTCSSEENGASIVLYSPIGKIHNFSYRLEFVCTNNVTNLESLVLGIENDFNFGCYHILYLGIHSL